MSEVQARPSASRGRGSSRGGRGSYGSRGGARAGSRSATNGTKPETIPSSSVEDEGEVGELKKKYSDKLATIKELFPDWTDEDVVYALQETDGDLEGTIERITEGSVSQWGEVKKKTKDRSRSKVKDAASASTSDASSLPTGRGAARGGRGGLEGGRAGRGRASERGRSHARGARAGSAVPTNGHRAKDTTDHTVDGAKTSIATDESSAWNATASKAGADSAHDTWDSTAAAAAAVVAADSNPTSERPSTSVIPGGTTKSWASMFAKPTPPPAPKKTAAPQAAPQTKADLKGANALPPPIPSDAKVDGDTTPIGTPLMNELDPTITPSKDELTETNVGQVPDTSIPPASATAASTVATSKDPRGGADGATPFSTTTQQSSSRPPTSGYAATAFKATGTPGRTSSFQRRVLDQQEAVVMPGNDALDRTTAPLGSMGSVDRAAVQFGSLGLNGASDDLDVDEDREEAETRAQPPQHSPVAHPRASLPPAPTSSMPSHQPAPKDMEPTPRHAPGFPPAAPSQQPPAPQQASPQAPVGPQTMTHQTSQGSHQYGQFNRYAQPQQDQSSANQKPYDPFGHANQAQSQPNQYDGYPSQAQGQGQAQQQQASQLGAFSSAPNDYSSYYTSDQQRGAYQNYYGSQYGQQAGQTPQDAGSTQQRAGSGYGHNAADSSQYPSAPGQPGQNRYPPATEATASAHSDHSTPNPSATGQQAPGAQSQQPPHPQGQAGGHNSYPYGHPYYSSPYYAAYMNQFGYGQGYNAPYGGKGGVYGQPHQSYGQSSYEHSSSPANLGGFGQPSQPGRDGGAGAGLGDYGRTGSAQPPQGQGHSSGGGAFGGMPDVFGRSGFQNQNVPLGQQAAHSQAGGDDPIKGYGDTKTTTGPSPLLNQPGRPGSATNAAPGQQGQSQAQNQQGFAGYPSHLNHHGHGGQGGQYGGLGGLGGGQSHQGSGYGQYGSGYGGSGYGYGSSGRGGGGWGGNYGH